MWIMRWPVCGPRLDGAMSAVRRVCFLCQRAPRRSPRLSSSGPRVCRPCANRAAVRVPVPALLLCGDQDPLIERPVIDNLIARRPDWDLRTFESAGHLLPLGVADVVGERWRHLASPQPRPACNGPPRNPASRPFRDVRSTSPS